MLSTYDGFHSCRACSLDCEQIATITSRFLTLLRAHLQQECSPLSTAIDDDHELKLWMPLALRRKTEGVSHQGYFLLQFLKKFKFYILILIT